MKPLVYKVPEDNPEWSGTITMSRMTLEDRINLQEALGVKQGKDGEVTTNEGLDNNRMLILMIRAAKPYIKEVCITHKATSTVLDEADDLETFPEAQDILIETVTFLMNGNSLGKS